MLLPEQFHAPTECLTTYQQYGGLAGELPIFLGLIAFSIRTNAVGYAFQICFRGGARNTHNFPHGRKCPTLFLLSFAHTVSYIGVDRRGMVVRVWSRPENSTPTWRISKQVSWGDTSIDKDQHESCQRYTLLSYPQTSKIRVQHFHHSDSEYSSYVHFINSFRLYVFKFTCTLL